MELNKIRQYTFTTEVIGTKRQLSLDQNSPLNQGTVTALRTRRYGANRKTLQGQTIANDVNFEGAFLVIKKGQDERISIPLEHIETATEVYPATGFPINWSGIDWAQCYVQITDGVTLDAGKVFEFTAEYI